MKVSDSWITEWSKQLDTGERSEVSAVRRYYQGQYYRGADMFISTGQTSQFTELFKVKDFENLYRSIYVNIGLRFANWYAKNNERLITKSINPKDYSDIWEQTFATESQRVAGSRIVLVQGTAKAELEKNLKKLMRDSDFQALGAQEKGRILRSRFNKLSQYQAERIVRTEATNAANLATERAALDIYGAKSLQKQWITAIDGRERPAHNAANGQLVEMEDFFSVGGEQLMRAGDPRGSAGNVINCRCAIAHIPKDDAEVTQPLDGFGFGLAAETIAFEGESVISSRKPAKEVVEEVVQAPLEAKTIKEAKEIFTNKFKEAGINVNKVVLGKGIAIKDINKMIVKFHKLADKYNISELRKDSIITLKFTGGQGYAGVVRYRNTGRRFDSQGNLIDLGRYGKLTVVDFGRGYNARPDGYKKSSFARNRTKDVDDRNFSTRGKSVSDSENWEVTTLSHEFAHYIDVWETSKLKDSFWKEMKEIRKQYINEIRKYAGDRNAKKFNEIYLGDYASTRIDEFFAEAFAEFETTNKPSKYALMVGELTLKYFGK